nr:MAG TPA: major capsid protein [Caudoviricetes sp.]
MKFTDSEIASTGAFLTGELEKLDQTLYAPYSDFTWTRDMPLRNDVTIADEVTSFILQNFAFGFGGTGAGTKSWIKGMSTTPAQTSVSGSKVTSPVTPWGMEVAYDIFELQKAMQVGRPIDVQKYDAMKLKHQMDIENMVYLGDAEVGVKGLLNNDAVVAKQNIGTLTDADADTCRNFFNTVLDAAWKATSYIRCPNRILIPPALYSKLASTPLPNTDKSLLEWIKVNNLAASLGNGVQILPCRMLADSSINSGKGRVVAYTMERDVVRFPLVQLQSMPVQYRSYQQVVPYYGALGAVEFVRPEMIYYGDMQ